MKRLLAISLASLAFVVILASTLCLPAAAVYEGNPNNAVTVYFPIHFDSYIVSVGGETTVMPWIGNEVAYGASQNHYSADQLYMLEHSQGQYTNGDEFIRNTYAGYPDFSLYAAQQTLQMDSLDQCFMWFGEDTDAVYTVSIACDVVTWTIENDAWVTKRTPVSTKVLTEAGDQFFLGRQLAYLVQHVTQDNLVTITDLRIDFKMVDPGGMDGMRIDFVGSPLTISPADWIGSWGDREYLYTTTVVQQVTVDSSGQNFFKWITGALGGIINTPIIGDFSIGGLLIVVICLGLTILLAKVL